MSFDDVTVTGAVGGEPVIGLIWAQTEDGVIGKDGGMPWHVPEDLTHFRRITTGHPVIMGRRTWESFPAKYRPLPDRTNIVVSSSGPLEGAVVVGSLQDALAEARRAPGAEQIWIIGGGKLYAEAVAEANAAVVTVIETDTDGDTYAPVLGPEWDLKGVSPAGGWLDSTSGTRYRLSLWARGSQTA
ncbi:dihydrofolate reductase [Arthrobacter sp. MSA 4-2]|uniref:dihydrofolate reductase n=1 Tax=Arthrobacter sp. MSA 4-2 TaxID=2794349 RepID=UPI0018E86F95|nr:dihydrofolate reductase [Arthrobacter sp. MSA 4-2]MBJ2120409.1 dihydrofolate reductase [Arthrobacter sp. MSA 4-2]